MLATVLTALALGAVLARACSRPSLRPWHVLAALLLMAGVGAALTPQLFVWQTDGLAKLGGDRAFAGYVGAVAWTTVLVTAVPAICGGAVFPYLLRFVEQSPAVGRTVGRLVAVNTAGAVVGSLVAGFVLLGGVGLWAGIRTIAALYLLLALAVAGADQGPHAIRIAAALALLLLVSFGDSARLPLVEIHADKRERLVEVREGADGIVSVVERGDDLRLKLDNHYSLGGSAGRRLEGVQADLPLALAGRRASVYFLGVGTGVTAGAALRHPVERLTAVELIPEVLDAARHHFAPYTSYAKLFARVPPERDPYLARLAPDEIAYVRAGEALHRAFTWQHVGRSDDVAPLIERFRESVPWDVYAAFRERIALLQ